MVPDDRQYGNNPQSLAIWKLGLDIAADFAKLILAHRNGEGVCVCTC